MSPTYRLQVQRGTWHSVVFVELFWLAKSVNSVAFVSRFLSVSKLDWSCAHTFIIWSKNKLLIDIIWINRLITTVNEHELFQLTGYTNEDPLCHDVEHLQSFINWIFFPFHPSRGFLLIHFWHLIFWVIWVGFSFRLSNPNVYNRIQNNEQVDGVFHRSGKATNQTFVIQWTFKQD